MAQAYIRQSNFADGDTITAALFNDEYNQLVNAFAYSSSSVSSTGHRHDGTAGQGGNIFKIGDLDFLNKVEIDSTNNRIGFYTEVSSAAVEQLRVQDGALVPVTDSDIDLGTTSLRFKDTFTDSITTTGNVSVGGNLTVTGTTTFNGGTITMGDADTDNVVFGANVDSSIIPDDDNTHDLGSSSQQWRNLYVDGTAYVDSINLNEATITATATELNLLDGVTATTAELNYVDVTTAGTVEASKAVIADSNADVLFSDNDKLKFGTSSDLQLYHDGTHSYVANSTNSLYLRTGTSVQIENSDGSEDLATFGVDGAVTLFHNNSAKLATTSSGVDVTGTVVADGGTFDGDVTLTGASADIVFDKSDNALEFATNAKAVFGGSLSISRIGNSSYIHETGSGDLYIKGSDIIFTDADNNQFIHLDDDGTGGTVRLKHEGSTKLTTTSSGISVTGNVSLSGNIVQSSDLLIDAGGDIFLDADGGDIKFKDAGTTFVEITNSSTDAVIKSTVSDKDIIFKGNDGGSEITALTLDMSAGGKAVFASNIDFGDGHFIGNDSDDNLYIASSATEDIRLDAAGNIILDADGGEFKFLDGGAENLVIGKTGSAPYLYPTAQDSDFKILGNDGGSQITALTLDMSDAGTATFNHDVKLGDNGRVKFGDGGDMSIFHNATDTFIQNATGSLIIENTLDDSDIVLKSDNGSGGTAAYITLDGSAALTQFDKDTKHVDSIKATFGNSADLEIHHDSNNSKITHTGSGGLYLGADTFALQNGTHDENFILMADNGAVTLYYDNSAKLATTSTGISVTGGIDVNGFGKFNSNTAEGVQIGGDSGGSTHIGNLLNSSGALTLQSAGSRNVLIDAGGDITLDADGGDIKFEDAGTHWLNFGNAAGSSAVHIDTKVSDHDLKFRGNDGGSQITALTLDMSEGGTATFNNGVIVGGDLTVQGTTTTLNTATLDVEDKNITLNKGSGDTSGSANGAGITIQDAVDASNDATILWDATNDEFDFSHPITIAGKVDATGAFVDSAENRGIKFDSTSVKPSNGSGGDADNHIDLGTSSTRFKDLHLSGTVSSAGGTMTSNLTLTGSNTGTNPAANGHIPSELRFFNSSNTDNNLNAIGFFNSSNAIDARIAGVHKSQSSRHGELAFLTHSGAALTEVMRISHDGKIGVNKTSPVVSIDAGANTDAIHVPVGTTAQRPTGAAGQFRYNTTTGNFEGYTSEWGAIAGSGSSGSSSFAKDTFTGDGSTTAFTMSTSMPTENGLIVFIDGVYQADNVYSVSGTTLTFATAPFNSRIIEVFQFKVSSIVGVAPVLATMTGDGSDTTLALGTTPDSENQTFVTIDGVVQHKDTYSISGSTLTFSTAPPNTSKVEAIIFNNVNVAKETFQDADGDTKIQVEESTDEDKIRFDTGGTERVIIDSSGNVGIGETSPAEELTVVGTIRVQSASGDSDGLHISSDSNGDALINAGYSVSDLKFATNDTERMRIDSSGNVLVGATSNNNDAAGIGLNSTGFFYATRSGSLAASFNRLTNDGTIADFRRDGNVSGTLNSVVANRISLRAGSTAGYLGVGSTDYFAWNTTDFRPTADDSYDLGASGARFDDIYATNGTIQTSDQNEKNTITNSDLGLDFINRLSPKSYKFNSKTRTHYGLIAQDVETVLSDISKSTTDFAGFIKDDISEEQDGSSYRYGLRYNEFISPLIKAIQEQQALIETQQTTITDLKSRIEVLETPEAE